MSTPRKRQERWRDIGYAWLGTLFTTWFAGFVIAVWPGIPHVIRDQLNGLVMVVGSTTLALLAAARPSSTASGRLIQRWVVPVFLLAAIIQFTAHQTGDYVVLLVALICTLLLGVAMWIEWRSTRSRD